jgi:bacteriorhodopsin
MPDNLNELLPFLIPLIVIQVGLTVAALISVLRRNTYRRGNRIIWVLVSFISIIGPIIYFTMGRGDE